VIAKWFERERGRAAGVAAMGPPAGGLLLVPLAGWLLESFGWRGTLQAFAVLSALIAPLALLVVRSSPGELGQEVDGGGAPRESEVTSDRPPAASDLGGGSILRSRNFWALALGIGIVFGLGGGWGAHAPRFGEDLGYSAQHMSLLVGIAAGLGIPATLLFGALADRFDNRALLWVGVLGQTLALAILWVAPNEWLFTGGIVLFGFAGGSLLPVYASLIGRLFGAPAFGRVMGLAGLVMLPFGAGAPVVAGAMRDASGSYSGVLAAFSLAFCLGVSLLGLIRMGEGEAAG
jgi:MFS family permease